MVFASPVTFDLLSIFIHTCICNYTCFDYTYTLGLTDTVLPSSSSTVMANTLHPQSSLTPVSQLSSMVYNQKNLSVASQPSSLVSIVSNTRTTTSPVTTLGVVECLTTSSSVVTCISGQHVSTVTGIAGMRYTYVHINVDDFHYIRYRSFITLQLHACTLMVQRHEFLWTTFPHSMEYTDFVCATYVACIFHTIYMRGYFTCNLHIWTHRCNYGTAI